MKGKYLLFAILFVIGLGFDQGTKIWARQNLKSKPTPTVVVERYFDFQYSENPGSAFGLFHSTPGARYFLFGIGLVCLGVVGMWVYKIPPTANWLAAKLGLLAGGAVGNIVDRVLYGRVTDFIVWKYTSPAGKVWAWPTFNIADAALVIGVIFLLLDWPRDAVFREMEEQEKAAAKGGKESDAPA